MTDSALEAGSPEVVSEALQAFFLALGTFVLEDPTAVAGGLLVADGQLSFGLAYLALFSGIAVGDLGLYGVGAWFGPQLSKRGWVSERRWLEASQWLQRRLLGAVVGSRFVPGARLPTYLAAGALRAPFWRFTLYAVVASAVWTGGLLAGTVLLGQAVEEHLDSAKSVFLVAIFLVVLTPSVLAGFRRDKGGKGPARRDAPLGKGDEGSAFSTSPRTRSRFEFWPPVLFYFPVALKYIALAVRYRGPTLPTAANPSIYAGGLIRESKSQILDLIPATFARYLPRHVTIERDEGPALMDRVRRVLSEAELGYPFVAKPDQGQRGAGVQLIRTEEQLSRYVHTFPVGGRILFQGLVDHPFEAGIFYYRCPKTDRGRILSMTLKEFPEVVGDGRSTLEALIEAHPRARHTARIFKRRHAEALHQVLPEGVKKPLVFAGNHCQGAVFRDGGHVLTPALETKVDAIARSIPGFYFGRFDVRFRDLDALQSGEGFGIVELNGVGAEVIHIWDPEANLFEAYRALFQQIELAFAIGAKNRARGARPLSLRALMRDILAYVRLSQAYPPAS